MMRSEEAGRQKGERPKQPGAMHSYATREARCRRKQKKVVHKELEPLKRAVLCLHVLMYGQCELSLQ